MNNFFNSLRYAWRGVQYVFKHEQNFRLQLVAAAIVIILIFVFELRRSEILVLLLLILSVLMLELLNSALEKFVDILKPRLLKQVQVVKDMMAAMVLLTAIGAVIIGTIIFWPHVVELLF